MKNIIKKPSNKLTIIASVVGVSLALVVFLGTMGIIAIGQWFDSHKIVSHQIVKVEFNPPFTIENRVAVIKKAPAPRKQAQLVKQVEASELPAKIAPVEQIVAVVHTLESSNGEAKSGYHVKCKEKGLSNEYGYGVYQGVCFANNTEAATRVKRWFSEELQSLTLAQALCKYNTGVASDNCDYYQNYLQLSK